MIPLHTPEEIKEICTKMDFGRDLMKLQSKYRMNTLSHIIDQIDDEVRIELAKYDQYIGEQCKHLYSDNPRVVIIDAFVFGAHSIFVRIIDNTRYFTYPAEDIELI